MLLTMSLTMSLTPTFPTPKLPATGAVALLRSWLARKLHGLSDQLLFGGLLFKLDPKAYRALPSHEPIECYIALLHYLDQHMPINWYAVEIATDHKDGTRDIDGDGPWWWDGVPIAMQGVDEEDVYFGGLDSDTLGLCLLLSVQYDYPVSHFQRLAGFIEDLRNRYHDADGNLPKRNEISVKPPRGRAWIKPWDALPDLWQYVNHSTGNDWLDWDQLAIDEGNAYPAWSIGEIRALSSLWRKASPVLTRIGELQAYIDKRPAERLPLLAGALLGDRAALDRITARVTATARRQGVRR